MDEYLQRLCNDLVDVTRQLRQLRPGIADAPEGLTAAEASALMGVFIAEKHGDEPRPGTIAEHLHITKSALSQTLKLLEEKGLISRARLKNDSRGVAIELQPSGRAIVEGILAKRAALFKEIVEHVGRDDIERALETARKVIAFCEDNAEPPSDDGAPCA